MPSPALKFLRKEYDWSRSFYDYQLYSYSPFKWSTKLKTFSLPSTTQLHGKPKTPNIPTLTLTASPFYTPRPGLSQLFL